MENQSKYVRESFEYMCESREIFRNLSPEQIDLCFLAYHQGHKDGSSSGEERENAVLKGLITKLNL